MIIYKSISALKSYLEKQKTLKKTIGFVPTMGALHEGHISLIYSSKKANDITIASVFVNPSQFNNQKDFEKYPSTIEQDVNKLEKAGCDILFHPNQHEIYPPEYNKSVYDLGNLETILEGEYRPGHFQGVAQVVDRLLTIVKPDVLYLGQKDFQQCMVIKKLISDKQLPVIVNIQPTVREADGLAMSSRNLRLDKQARAKAPLIYQALQMVQKDTDNTDPGELKKKASVFLAKNGFNVDYVEIAEADSLKTYSGNNNKTPKVILIAASIGDIRLIDNLLLE